jgi:hypothetical protein
MAGVSKKKHFTNEHLAKKFKSNFDLVSYAIQLAENMIKTGRDARVKSEVQNKAMLVLEEISEGKDVFDEISVGSSKKSSEEKASHENELHFDLIAEEPAYEKRRGRAMFSDEDE